MSPTNSSTADTRDHHDIPNPQVLDAADQFRNGFQLLAQQPPGSGVLLPALQCGAIAIELYLKSLSARAQEVPDTSMPGLVAVYAGMERPSHLFGELFDQAPADAKADIERRVTASSQLQRFAGARLVLEAAGPLFVASRYPFEAGRRIDEFGWMAFKELVVLIGDAVHALPPRLVT